MIVLPIIQDMRCNEFQDVKPHKTGETYHMFWQLLTPLFYEFAEIIHSCTCIILLIRYC